MILVPKVLIVPIVLVLIWSKIHFRLVFSGNRNVHQAKKMLKSIVLKEVSLRKKMLMMI